MAKRTLFIVALILFGVLAYLTNKFIPVQGIRYFYFVPTILCIEMLINIQKLNIKNIAITILGCIIYIWSSNLFNLNQTMNDGIWCIVGGVITYLVTLLYGYAKKEGAKQVKNEITTKNKTTDTGRN